MQIVRCADGANMDYTKWTREDLIRLRGQLEAETDSGEATVVAREIERRNASVDAAHVFASAPPITSVPIDGTSSSHDTPQPDVEHKAFHLSGSTSGGLSGWRKMTWALHAWNAIFVIWIVWGIANVSDVASGIASSCAQDPSVTGGILTQQECEDASNAGAAIGASIGFGSVLMFWFVGFVVLALVWFMTKPATRPCPVCGESVRKGRTVCDSCGHDFAQAVALPA
jgi:hypothetical protein